LDRGGDEVLVGFQQPVIAERALRGFSAYVRFALSGSLVSLVGGYFTLVSGPFAGQQRCLACEERPFGTAWEPVGLKDIVASGVRR
jgi:hypothetical protein